MFVIKRNGTKEKVEFDKITTRVESLCEGLNEQFINPTKVAQKVTGWLEDGMTTQQVDTLATDVAADMGVYHPDYLILAGRIAVSNLQKSINCSFSEAMQTLYDYKIPVTGEHAPAISKELNDIIQANKERLNAVIVPERDFLYNIFGIGTLREGYLLRAGDEIMETPQFMHLRVALGIHKNNIDDAVKMYHLTSLHYYTHSTPTLFNSGTNRPQLASCFLLAMKDDSIQGIYDTLSECALISKYAGGIGMHIHNVRSEGSHIKGTNGRSDGIVPMLQVFNYTARYVNQAGKRKGAFAIYLEPHHADIFKFIDLRKNSGSEELRTKDLFIAVWLSDLFMSRVKNNQDWSLFDPNDAPGLEDVYGDDYVELYTSYEKQGLAKKVVPAQELWTAILTSQIETGTPYLLNKDQCNIKSNQKNLGTIKSSNLCVAPETPILTDKGYIPIADLKDQEVNVWNGEEWSTTTVRQTGEDQKLIKVVLSNGAELECTPYHKFYVETGTRPSDKSVPLKVDAGNLTVGAKLIKCDFPVLDGEDFPYAYTHGFFCGDGTYQNNKYGIYEKSPRITLYGEKKNLIDHLDIRTSSFKETTAGTINVMLPHNIPEKFTVPINSSVKSKLEWFAGLCDSDGTVSKNGDNESIQIASIHKDFLMRCLLMLQTLGCNPKVRLNKGNRTSLLPNGRGGLSEYDCKPIYRLLLSSVDTISLLDLGLKTHRLDFSKHVPQRNARQFVKVVAVIDEGRVDDTYCFTEEKRGMGVFGGILTGQCSEIVEYSSPEETATCNLAQINLAQCVTEGGYNFERLTEVAQNAIYNLDKVIDESFYPVETAKRSNMRHRPLGLGVSGLHDVFFKLKLAFDSPEAAQLNRQIFETIYRAAVLQSVELAKMHGPYETFEGSPASQGILQCDMWGDIDLFYDDWDEIRNLVQTHGLRNSLLVALMPTASSSTILGVTECFEPQTSNIYSRRVLSGQYTVINKYLVSDLIELGLWSEAMSEEIIYNGGSIQNIASIPQHLKDIYRTAWEYKMRPIITMAAERSPFVDQSQSLNLYMKDPTIPKLNSMHMFSWQNGLKTMSYYLRTRASTDAVKFTVGDKKYRSNSSNNSTKSDMSTDRDDFEDCLMCSA
jgi:ribonucleoside-diphosphate reductase alpha chain